MTVVSAGLWAFDLDDAVGPPTQTFVTRRRRLADNRPVVQVYNNHGNAIGRLSGEVGPVMWRIDGYGTVSMRLSPREFERKSDLLTPGNPVKIEFTNGLPPWGGVIDLPWEYPRDAVTVTFYSAEYMLGWAVAEEYANYTTDDRFTWMPNEVLADVMTREAVNERYRIDPYGGTMGQGTEGITVDGRGDDLLTIADAIRSAAPEFHWHIAPMRSSSPSLSGSLRFSGRYFYHYRRDRRDAVMLVEGHNFTNVEVVTQGPLYNHVTVTAGNYDPADMEKRAYIWRHGGAGVGLRERYVVLPEVIGIASRVESTGERIEDVLRRRAQAEYERWCSPRVRIRGRVLNKPPALFGSYEIGDVVTIVLNRQPSRTVVAPYLVIGMEFDPGAGLLTLIGENMTAEQLRRKP